MNLIKKFFAGFAFLFLAFLWITVLYFLHLKTCWAENGSIKKGAFYSYQENNQTPGPPGGLMAIPGDQQVTLTWSPSPEPDLSYYKIYRSQLKGFIPSAIDSLNVVFFPDTSDVDSNVTNGITYYYRISAVDLSANESHFSEEVEATPRADANSANIAFSALSYDFGKVPLFSSVSWSLMIVNNGSANLEVKNIESNNPVFTVTIKQVILEPAQQCQIQIHFKPDSVQAEFGILTILSNDPDQPEIKIALTGKGIDIQAPQIIMQQSAQTMQVNSEYIVSAQISDNWAIGSTSLFYRNGSDLNFKSVVMNSVDNNNYVAAIPDSDVTVTGVAYFIKAEDRLGNTTYSDTVSHEIYFPDNYFQTNTIYSAYQMGYPRGQWCMLSIPAVLNNPTLSAVLNDESELNHYGEPNWRLFSYEDTNNDGITDGYQEYHSVLEADIFQFKIGKAFWLKTNPDGINIVIDAGEGHVLPLQPYVITLKPGWNQIGNPFAFPITFTPSHENIVDKLYLPDGNGGYELTSRMRPWAGYFVYVEGNQQTDLTFHPVVSGPLQKPIVDDADWMIQIAAYGKESKDEINYFGINKLSSDSWDKRDYPEPPMIGDYISLRFPHPEWNKNCNYFTSDFRNDIEKGQVWNLEIVSHQSTSLITLRWLKVINPESDLKFILYDKSQNKTIDMNLMDEFSFIKMNNETRSSFQILVGKHNFINDQLTTIQSQTPKDFRLYQNYPNPFNLTTTISFDLPDKTPVKLSVFDIQGKLITTILNQDYEAGHHEIQLHIENFVSGLYFYQLEAEGFIDVKKMIVLK